MAVYRRSVVRVRIGLNFIPNDTEMKAIKKYERDGKDIYALSEEDQECFNNNKVLFFSEKKEEAILWNTK